MLGHIPGRKRRFRHSGRESQALFFVIPALLSSEIPERIKIDRIRAKL
jgi:hypothetical protein